MSNKKWLVSLMSAAALTVSTGALAQATVPNFYIGADIGQTDVGADDKDTGFKFYGGYQFHRNIAAELGYGLLYDKNSVEVTSLEAVAVGLFPINNQFSIFGKLGFARLTLEAPGTDDDETELTWGLGVQWDFNKNLGVRAGFQRYETDEAIDFIHAGVVWRF